MNAETGTGSSWLSHLVELRARLVRALIAVIVWLVVQLLPARGGTTSARMP